MYSNIKFIFFILLNIFAIGSSKNCFWNAKSVYKNLSSKTPYHFVRGDIRDSKVNVEGCNPVSIWGIFRHEKRKPYNLDNERLIAAVSIRNYVIDSYKKGRSLLCAQDVDNLRDWKYDPESFDGIFDMTEEGKKEMFGIGKRLKEAFTSVLDHIPRGSYEFRPAKGSLFKKSIRALVAGLDVPDLVIEEAKPGIDVMDPFLTCYSYRNATKNYSVIYAEADKYKRTSEYLATKERIQRRTGIDYNLTVENITALYDLCRYTWSGIDGIRSPWCALFTKDDLEVLEYDEDLKHYYRNGYGKSVNEVFGKVTLGDLFTNFESVTKGDGKKIVAYVTHTTSIDQMITAFGLFKDTKPITGAKRDPDRKWRTSTISVLSVNLVAVLNRCVKEGSSKYNVVFYLNEEPIRPICEEGVCSWEEFDAKLRPFVNTTIDFCESNSEFY